MNMFELARLIEREKIPYWIMTSGCDRVLFKYPPGVVEGWKKKLDEMIEEDMKKNPYIVRGSGKD